MLAELCCNINISSEILQYLLEKLCNLTKYIEEANTHLGEFTDSGIIEKSPHFIEMSHKVLMKWKGFFMKEIKGSTNARRQEQCELVTSLWKSKWEVGTSKEEDDVYEGNLTHIEPWKKCVQDLINVSSNGFPLITHQVWPILEFIESFKNESRASCKYELDISVSDDS